MNATVLFSIVPLSLLFVFTVVLLLAAAEVGSWTSRCCVKVREHDSPVGSMVAALLGLLAFMLAFTFGMTTTRFDQRRQLVIDEANAISSAFLLSTLRKDGSFPKIQEALREYLNLRLNVTRENVAARLAQSDVVFHRLWSLAKELMNEKRESDLRTSLIGSINQLANIQRTRATVAIQYRIPGSMWLSLYSLAVISMLAIGYQVGTTGAKRLWAMPVLVLAFALVLSMIADFDRPTNGQLRIGDEPLRQVGKMMESIGNK